MSFVAASSEVSSLNTVNLFNLIFTFVNFDDELFASDSNRFLGDVLPVLLHLYRSQLNIIANRKVKFIAKINTQAWDKTFSQNKHYYLTDQAIEISSRLKLKYHQV
jgi:hypothetical protein